MRRHCDRSGRDFERGQSTSGLPGSEGLSVPAGVYREGTLGPKQALPNSQVQYLAKKCVSGHRTGPLLGDVEATCHPLNPAFRVHLWRRGKL